MNTRKKTMHTKREESDNGEDNLGFCNQSLRMHIFSSLLQGLVCPRIHFSSIHRGIHDATKSSDYFPAFISVSLK